MDKEEKLRWALRDIQHKRDRLKWLETVYTASANLIKAVRATQLETR